MYTRSVPRFWLEEIWPQKAESRAFRLDPVRGIRAYRRRVEKECGDKLTKADAKHLLQLSLRGGPADF